MQHLSVCSILPCTAAGAAQPERQSTSAAAAVDHMTREEAYATITAAHPVRTIVRDALYEYWRIKRERIGKPLVRRLQAPTSSSDQNPFAVFRCFSLDTSYLQGHSTHPLRTCHVSLSVVMPCKVAGQVWLVIEQDFWCGRGRFISGHGA